MLVGIKGMTQGLFTNMTKYLRSSRLFLHVVVSTSLIVGFAILAEIVQQSNKINLINSIQVAFRNDRDVGNTSYLSRRISDLETFGLIKCVSISSLDLGIIYSTEFKSSCQRVGIFGKIFDPTVTVDIKALSGEVYGINFKSNSDYRNNLYIFVFLLLIVILANFLISLHWYRLELKARDLQRQQELNRFLDIKVHQQANELVRMRLDGEIQKAVAKLARQVAHDIRSPLSLLKALSYKFQTELPEEAKLLTDVSSRIIQIAEDLLDASRISNSVSQVDRESKASLDQSTLLSSREIAKLCENAVIEKKIELQNNSNIRIQIYNELVENYQVMCDESGLKRIISNLLNNAIEAIPVSGFVTLTIANFENGISIDIRDSGIGMPKDLIDRVFQGPTTEGKIRGNGLGLHSSIQKLKEWGGKLSIHSDIGKGAVVSLFLVVP